jgi:hypothetical protein
VVTTGDANTALSRLSTLGLPKLADWLMEPGRGDRLDRPAVQAMIRDVVALTADELGYRAVPGHPDAGQVRRLGTRTRLLIRWATDPTYRDDDTTTGEPR